MYNHDERVDKGELGEMQNKITSEKISQLESERSALEEGTGRNQLHG